MVLASSRRLIQLQQLHSSIAQSTSKTRKSKSHIPADTVPVILFPEIKRRSKVRLSNCIRWVSKTMRLDYHQDTHQDAEGPHTSLGFPPQGDYSKNRPRLLLPKQNKTKQKTVSHPGRERKSWTLYSPRLDGRNSGSSPVNMLLYTRKVPGVMASDLVQKHIQSRMDLCTPVSRKLTAQ